VGSDFLYAEIQLPQSFDGGRRLQLVGLIKAVACPLVHLGRNQQTLLLIKPQSLHRQHAKFGKLTDFEHGLHLLR